MHTVEIENPELFEAAETEGNPAEAYEGTSKDSF